MPNAGTSRFLIELGLRIVELREQIGLTQEQLAERVIFSSRYIQRLEAGTANVSVSFLPTLAGALECSVADLFGRPAKSTLRRIGRPKGDQRGKKSLAGTKHRAP